MPIDQRLRDRNIEQADVQGGGLIEWANREARPVIRRVRDVLNAILVAPKSQAPSSNEIAIDWRAKRSVHVTLDASVTLVSFIDPADCGDYWLLITQTAAFTVAGWPSNVAFAGGVEPTITATSGRTDKFQLYWDGETYWTTLSQNLE